MTFKVMYVETHRDSKFIYGNRYVDGEFDSEWMQMTDEYYNKRKSTKKVDDK